MFSVRGVATGTLCQNVTVDSDLESINKGIALLDEEGRDSLAYCDQIVPDVEGVETHC